MCKPISTGTAMVAEEDAWQTLDTFNRQGEHGSNPAEYTTTNETKVRLEKREAISNEHLGHHCVETIEEVEGNKNKRDVILCDALSCVLITILALAFVIIIIYKGINRRAIGEEFDRSCYHGCRRCIIRETQKDRCIGGIVPPMDPTMGCNKNMFDLTVRMGIIRYEKNGSNLAAEMKTDNFVIKIQKKGEENGRFLFKQNHDTWTNNFKKGMIKEARNITKKNLPNFRRNFWIICCIYLTMVQPINSLQTEIANQAMHFGEDVKLECSFQQKKGNLTDNMQWYKGNSESLTHGRTSSNTGKYTVDLIQKGNFCRYILTIRNLSVGDFDTYNCHYHFDKSSLAMYPDKTPFVYIPSEKDVTASVTGVRQFKVVTFSIGLVYPKPSCSWISNAEMENLQTNCNVEHSTDGLLYRTNITVNYMIPVTTCADDIDMICNVSGFSFNKSVRINDTGCQDDFEYTGGLVSLVITCVCFVVVIVVIRISISRFRKCKRDSTTNEETNDRVMDELQNFMA